MATPRPRGARIATGALGVALLGAAAAVPLHDLGFARQAVALPALLGILVAVAGVVRGWTSTPAWGAGMVAVTYAAAVLVRHGPVERGAPLVAAGLLLGAELLAWSIELRTPVRVELGVLALRGLATAGLALAGLAAAAAVLATVAVPRTTGLQWAALGASAAVAALALLARLARQ